MGLLRVRGARGLEGGGRVQVLRRYRRRHDFPFRHTGVSGGLAVRLVRDRGRGGAEPGESRPDRLGDILHTPSLRSRDNCLPVGR